MTPVKQIARTARPSSGWFGPFGALLLLGIGLAAGCGHRDTITVHSGVPRTRPDLGSLEEVLGPGDQAIVAPTFVAPEGWQAGESSAMVPVRFRLPGQAPPAGPELKITRLAASAGDWAMNVQRWAGQVGAAPLTAEEIAARTSSVSVDNHAGQSIRIDGPAPEGSHQTQATGEGTTSEPNSILAAMIVVGEDAWFVTLAGSRSVVDQHTETFDRFLDSIKFP
jgi:hypothetical protein